MACSQCNHPLRLHSFLLGTSGIMNIPEMLHALHETDSLMSDTDPQKTNFIKYSMTIIVVTVIKVNYEGIMKADS